MRRRWVAMVATVLVTTPGAWPRDQHYSFWSDNPQPYLEAIERATGQTKLAVPTGEKVCGGIVTHHFLASGLMVRFFAELKGHSSPETIVLLGPNHFHQGLANISVSSLPWKTPFGLLRANKEVVREISKAVSAREDPEAFLGEHSIGVLVPFLKYYFPKSRVVPVLIDVNAEKKGLHALLDVLRAQAKDPKTLLLLSMDFSHDSGAAAAEARDRQAQEVVMSLDTSKTSELYADCRKGLWVLLEAEKGAGCGRVQILEHTNSGQLLGRPDQPEVTSYFTVWFVAEP